MKHHMIGTEGELVDAVKKIEEEMQTRISQAWVGKTVVLIRQVKIEKNCHYRRISDGKLDFLLK